MGKNKIIIAMDNRVGDGLELVGKTMDSSKVYGYKIGSLWILEDGIQTLIDLKETALEGTDKKIVLDMQKWGTDIPAVVERQVQYVAPFIDELIACPMGGGRESLKAFAASCIDAGIKPICVIKMTQPEAGRYLRSNAALMIYEDAIQSGISSFVIPATKDPRDLSFMKSGEKYATGFKVHGGQTKPMVEFGVSKFIVGRAVYEAESPTNAIDSIYDEISGGE